MNLIKKWSCIYLLKKKQLLPLSSLYKCKYKCKIIILSVPLLHQKVPILPGKKIMAIVSSQCDVQPLLPT